MQRLGTESVLVTFAGLGEGQPDVKRMRRSEEKKEEEEEEDADVKKAARKDVKKAEVKKEVKKDVKKDAGENMEEGERRIWLRTPQLPRGLMEWIVKEEQEEEEEAKSEEERMLRAARRVAYETVVQLAITVEKTNQERELGDMQVEDKTEEEWESDVEDTLLDTLKDQEGEEPEEGEVGQYEDTLRLLMGLAAAEVASE